MTVESAFQKANSYRAREEQGLIEGGWLQRRLLSRESLVRAVGLLAEEDITAVQGCYMSGNG
jgi:hypothetical protein